jgi:hypothetical protein
LPNNAQVEAIAGRVVRYSNICKFSFSNVCQLLDLIPETVREEVLGDMSLGAFGYWSRRCGRIARRFKVFLSNIFTNERTANAAEPVT